MVSFRSDIEANMRSQQEKQNLFNSEANMRSLLFALFPLAIFDTLLAFMMDFLACFMASSMALFMAFFMVFFMALLVAVFAILSEEKQ